MEVQRVAILGREEVDLVPVQHFHDQGAQDGLVQKDLMKFVSTRTTLEFLI